MQNHSVIKSFTNDRAGAQQIEGEMPALELHHQGLAMPDQFIKAIARPWPVLGQPDATGGVGGAFGLLVPQLKQRQSLWSTHVAGESRCQHDPSRSSHSTRPGTEQFSAGCGNTVDCCR